MNHDGSSTMPYLKKKRSCVTLQQSSLLFFHNKAYWRLSPYTIPLTCSLKTISLALKQKLLLQDYQNLLIAKSNIFTFLDYFYLYYQTLWTIFLKLSLFLASVISFSIFPIFLIIFQSIGCSSAISLKCLCCLIFSPSHSLGWSHLNLWLRYAEDYQIWFSSS